MLATLVLTTTPGNQANAASVKPAELVSFPSTHITQVADDLQLVDGNPPPILDGRTQP